MQSRGYFAAHGLAVQAEFHEDPLIARHAESAPLVQAIPNRVPRLVVGEHTRQGVRHGVDQSRIRVPEADGVVVAGGGSRQAKARVKVLLPRLLEDAMDRGDLEAALDARVRSVLPVRRPSPDMRDHHRRLARPLEDFYHVADVGPDAGWGQAALSSGHRQRCR